MGNETKTSYLGIGAYKPNLTARWSAELNVDCPHCGDTFDYTETEHWANGGFDQLNEVFQATKNVEAECPYCEKEFKFDIEAGQ